MLNGKPFIPFFELSTDSVSLILPDVSESFTAAIVSDTANKSKMVVTKDVPMLTAIKARLNQ